MFTTTSLTGVEPRAKQGECFHLPQKHNLYFYCSSWREHKIQLAHIHKCHLLDYQSQLQSILLSHCHYSLRMGESREVSYDLPALEKYVLDRFIHGKPTILVDIPRVSYQEDIHSASALAAVRKNVAPQVKLFKKNISICWDSLYICRKSCSTECSWTSCWSWGLLTNCESLWMLWR